MGWKRSYFNFALNVFFIKELKGAILSLNHWRRQGVAQGAQDPQSKCHQRQKFDEKALFLHFQFLLAFLRKTVHAYNKN